MREKRKKEREREREKGEREKERKTYRETNIHIQSDTYIYLERWARHVDPTCLRT